MSQGIFFFEKNKIDLDQTDIVITITDNVAIDDGAASVNFLRNRKNDSGWATTESNDSANTQIDISIPSNPEINNILLKQHNLKSYTIQHFDGVNFIDFSTPINVAGNTDVDKRHTFNSIFTTKIRIIITGTMVVDEDKFLAQLIITQSIGQFTRFPIIADPTDSKNRRILQAISGKVKVIRSSGAFSCTLEDNNVVDTADLIIVERLFNTINGFLVWLSGGDTTQFRTQRIGYRKKDIFLMAPINEYKPEWQDGFYQHGTKITINLVEVL